MKVFNSINSSVVFAALRNNVKCDQVGYVCGVTKLMMTKGFSQCYISENSTATLTTLQLECCSTTCWRHSFPKKSSFKVDAVVVTQFPGLSTSC